MRVRSRFSQSMSSRFCTIVLVVFALALLAGCGSQREILLAEQRSELDSLYEVSLRLAERVQALEDSLQFYDDVESGQYFRDRRMLVQEIERLEYEIGLFQDGGRTLQTILVDDLFAPASAELTDGGRRRLTVLADTLKSGWIGYQIRVEGHSDSTPIGPSISSQYPSNWELSAARASAVVRFLVEEHEIPAGQIAVTSHGSTRPVARNDIAEGRRANRRIRIAVVPR